MSIHNLARMYSTTTGTSDITLGTAVPGYLTFIEAGCASSETVPYGIYDGPSASEVGHAVFNSSNNTLTSRTPSDSTDGGAAINLSGTAEVFISALSSYFYPLASVPAFSANKGGTNQTGVVDQTVTLMTASAVAVNDGSYYTSSDSRWTPPPGVAVLGLRVTFNSTRLSSGTGQFSQIHKNGVAIANGQVIANLAAGANQMCVTQTVSATNGSDYFEPKVNMTLTSTSVTGTINGQTFNTEWYGFMVSVSTA